MDYKESWAPKNWCFWTMVLEKTLESPLDCKEIQPVNSKGNQSWIFIGWAECWSWNSNTLATWCKELTHWEKTLMLGKIDGRRRRGWQRMRSLDGITDSMDMFEQALGVHHGWEAWRAAVHGVVKSQTWLCDWTELSSSWGSHGLCCPWGHKESDMTEPFSLYTVIYTLCSFMCKWVTWGFC